MEKQQKYTGIPLETFVGGSKAVVDLHVKIGEDKYVKVVAAGADFELQRLSRYEDKEVTHLYIKREDFGAFTQHSAKITEIVTTKSPANIRQKMSMLLRTSEHIFTEIADLGVDQNSLNHAVQVCQSTMTVVENNPNIVDMLDELSKYSQDFARHSLGTSMLSVMMVQALNWHGKKTLSMASLGGLLHDVGMREIAPELLTKPRAEMTKEEVEAYLSHPLRGVMILKEVKGIPAEVLGIVGEHHELPSGAGFPRAIKGDKIFPLSRAVAFADNLADLVLKSDRNPEPKDLAAALEFLQTTMKHDFHPSYFDAAKRLLGSLEGQKKNA